MDLSKKIKALREEQGLTLEEVGKRVGVGKSTVRKWENGVISNMKRDKIPRLAKAFGVTPAYLMGWEDEKKLSSEIVDNKVEFKFDGTSKELIDIIKTMDGDSIANLLNYARFLQLQNNNPDNELIVKTK